MGDVIGRKDDASYWASPARCYIGRTRHKVSPIPVGSQYSSSIVPASARGELTETERRAGSQEGSKELPVIVIGRGCNLYSEYVRIIHLTRSGM
jgi:hypothetical protein